MIKKIFALASVATCCLFNPSAAQARQTSYCYNTGSATVCIHRVRSHNTLGSARKEVLWSVNGGQVRRSEVDCTQASPSNYKDNLWGIACFEFN